MDNSEIRARILRFHYDLQMNRPSTFFDIDELPRLMTDVPQNLIDANVLYLYNYRLIAGIFPTGRVTPKHTHITNLGIDVVENPQGFSGQYSLNVNALNIGTNYGQVAQADPGATVIQTQACSSFNDLRELVRSRADLTEADRQRINAVLGSLEKTVAEKGVTKTVVEQAKQALADYGWLIQPVITVLMKALGLE